MAAMIKGSRYLSRVAGRESEIPALMWAAAAFVAVGASVSSGWSMTVLNQLLPRGVNDPGDMSNDMKLLDDNWVQQIASSMTIAGAAVGSFLDCIPRLIGFRWTLVGPISILFLGGSIACGLDGFACLLIGRFLVGVASGLAGIVAPVLLAESSAPMVRGKLTALHQLGFTFGVLLSSVIGLGMVRNVEHGWRYVFWTGAVFPLFLPLGACLGLLPESPRWMIRWGGSDGRKRAYIQLLGLRPLEHDARAELRAMVKEARREETGRTAEISSGVRYSRSRPGRRRRSKVSHSRAAATLLQESLLDADAIATDPWPRDSLLQHHGGGGAEDEVPQSGVAAGELLSFADGSPLPQAKPGRSHSTGAPLQRDLLGSGAVDASGAAAALLDDSKGLLPGARVGGGAMPTGESRPAVASHGASRGAARAPGPTALESPTSWLATPITAVVGAVGAANSAAAMLPGPSAGTSHAGVHSASASHVAASATGFRKQRAVSQGTGVVLSRLQPTESGGTIARQGSRAGSGRGGRRSRTGSDETLRDVAAAGVGHALPVAASSRTSISWCALMCEMRNRHLLYPVFVGCMLVLGLSGCGLNVVLLYSSRIYGLIELDDPMLATCITFGVYFVATIGGMFLVDMVGRKTLLAAGYAVMFVSLAALAVTILAIGETNKEASGYIALACLLVFVAGYSVGPGVATFVVLSEIVPTVIRVRAFSIFMFTNWTVQLVLGLLALDAIGLLGTQSQGKALHEQARRGVGLLFLGFSAVCLLAIGAVLGLVPETRGRSLESVRKSMLSRWKRVETETKHRRRNANGGGCCCDWCICCAAGRAAADDGDAAKDLRDDDSVATSVVSRADSGYKHPRFPKFAAIEASGGGSVGGPDEGDRVSRFGQSGMPTSTPLAIAEASTEDVARVPLGGYSALGASDDVSGVLQIPNAISTAALVQEALARDDSNHDIV